MNDLGIGTLLQTSLKIRLLRVARGLGNSSGVFDGVSERGFAVDVLKNQLPAAGWKEGYEATVTAIKAHEAVMKGGKVELSDELFNIA